MVERPDPTDTQYLERMVAHLDHKLIELLAERRLDRADLDRMVRIAAEVPTKGDIQRVVKAVEILEARQTESRELLKSIGQKIAYVTTVAGLVAGVLLKNADLRELFSFWP